MGHLPSETLCSGPGLLGSSRPSLARGLEKELFSRPSLEGAENVTFGAGQGLSVGPVWLLLRLHWGP